MSEMRRMWPDEIAAALKARDDEVNETKAEVAKLRRKLNRISTFITEYGTARMPAVGHVVHGDLQRAITDIINNAYEEKA